MARTVPRAADFTVNGIYEVRSLTKTGLPDDLYGKLNEQIAHLAYQRTKDPTRQIGAQELQQLSDLIEDEAANFRCHLDESFKPYWNDDGRPKFEPGTMLRQNLSTTAVSTAVFDMSRSRGQTPE
jgi:hypothetical protein